jgi:hypothetical protein
MVQWLGVSFRFNKSVGDGRVIIIAWHTTPKLPHLFTHMGEEDFVNKTLNSFG